MSVNNLSFHEPVDLMYFRSFSRLSTNYKILCTLSSHRKIISYVKCFNCLFITIVKQCV